MTIVQRTIGTSKTKISKQMI